MKLIDLYNEWMKTGRIFNRMQEAGLGGLCNAVPEYYLETLKLFEPEKENFITYWGHEESEWCAETRAEVMYRFTPLR